MRYYLDCPNPNTRNDDDSWCNVGVVASLEDGRKIIEQKWGLVLAKAYRSMLVQADDSVEVTLHPE